MRTFIITTALLVLTAGTAFGQTGPLRGARGYRAFAYQPTPAVQPATGYRAFAYQPQMMGAVRYGRAIDHTGHPGYFHATTKALGKY